MSCDTQIVGGRRTIRNGPTVVAALPVPSDMPLSLPFGSADWAMLRWSAGPA